MLQSNQPYQRVDDGLGNGFIAGAVVGGAAAYGAHKTMQMGMTNAMKKGFSQYDSTKGASSSIMRPNADGTIDIAQGQSVMKKRQEQAAGRQQAGLDAMNSSKWSKAHNNYFGSKDSKGLYKTNIHPAIDGIGKMNRRGAITAGLSILGGGLVGMGMDAMN